VSFEDIKLEQSGPVTTLILARPESRNAMTERMGIEIAAAIDGLGDTRALVVRGEGKVFSAGGDFSFIEARSKDSAENNRRAMRRFYGLYLSILRSPVPTIAVLHGAALGAGLCFAMACDLRLAAASTKMALNFVRIGLHPGMGATYFLPRLVGSAKAAELLLTGRTFDAPEAERMGLINAVCADAEIASRSDALAREIAESAPLAVARTTRSLRQSSAGLEEALEREAMAQALDYQTDDLQEGIRAFHERRAPVYSGR
jgi:enoyl-CoA hydratase/carnithine racemase